MDQFEYYTFKKAINNKYGFTIIKPQWYYKWIDNIQRVGNLISDSKLELERVPRQTSQINEPPQGGGGFNTVFDDPMHREREIGG